MRAIMAGDASACYLRVIHHHRGLEAGVGGIVTVGTIRGAGHMRGRSCKGG